MEDEKVRFLSAMLTHMARSVHLPATLLREIIEGKMGPPSGGLARNSAGPPV